MKINNKYNFRNYLIVLIVLLYDSSPFFLSWTYHLWIPIFLVLLILVNKKELFSLRITIFIITTYLLVLLQGILFGGFSPAALYKPIMLFITPLLLLRLLGTTYFKYLFNIIYFLAIFCTIIWVFHNIYPAFFFSLADIVYKFNWDGEPRSLLFYSVENSRATDYLIYRNAGFLHEPGAFAIYILLAIFINVIFSKKYFNRKTIVLIIIGLTTFSTMFYTVLSIYILFVINSLPALNKSVLDIIPKVLIFSVVIYLGTNVFLKADFLGKEIQANYQAQIGDVEQNRLDKRGRFYSFFTSFKLASNSPIIGRGIIEKTRDERIAPGSAIGYGFPGFFMRYGFVIGLIYMFYFYKGIHSLSKRNNLSGKFAMVSFLILNLALLSQVFFLHIPFVMLFILGLNETKKLRRKSHFYVKLNHQLV